MIDFFVAFGAVLAGAGIVLLLALFVWAATRRGQSGDSGKRRRTRGYVDSDELQRRRAGRLGECAALELLRAHLRPGDRLLNNVEFSYDGRRAELDLVVVNPCGVFLIEVKNYSGRLEGDVDDPVWLKYKRSRDGLIYRKKVGNPIRQMKREVYLLAHYLERGGVRVWVEGYVLLMQWNSPVADKTVLSAPEQIDRALHTPGRTRLSARQIDAVERLLRPMEKN